MSETSAGTESIDRTPTFSIIVAAYNAEKTIGATVESVLSQDCDDWELVIVDDGSTDDTAEVALAAAGGDPRVQLYSQANAGVGAARNTAMTHARGEFLCILDADDCYLPNYLSSQQDMIERHPDLDLYSCNGIFVFPNGLRVPVHKGPRFKREQAFSVEEMLERNLIFIMVIIRRSAFDRVDGFRPLQPARLAEDYELFMRIMLSGGGHIYNPGRLGLYNLTEGSLSTAADVAAQARLDILNDLAEEFPHIRGPHLDQVLDRQRMMIDIARMERRLTHGDNAGARKAFFAAWPALPTRARQYVGGATMIVHPQLYRRVFLGRLYPPESSEPQ